MCCNSKATMYSYHKIRQNMFLLVMKPLRCHVYQYILQLSVIRGCIYMTVISGCVVVCIYVTVISGCVMGCIYVTVISGCVMGCIYVTVISGCVMDRNCRDNCSAGQTYHCNYVRCYCGALSR